MEGRVDLSSRAVPPRSGGHPHPAFSPISSSSAPQIGATLARQRDKERAQGWGEHREHGHHRRRHHLSSVRSPTPAPGLFRFKAITSPRPTAASAAATAITKRARTWPARVSELLAEADQTEVYRIEHDLGRDEHQDDVAPGEEAEHSDPKEDSAQSQNRARRRDHDPAPLLLARTTAPTMAARSTREPSRRATRTDRKAPMYRTLP